jgi:hypothetical protein
VPQRKRLGLSSTAAFYVEKSEQDERKRADKK